MFTTKLYASCKSHINMCENDIITFTGKVNQDK